MSVTDRSVQPPTHRDRRTRALQALANERGGKLAAAVDRLAYPASDGDQESWQTTGGLPVVDDLGTVFPHGLRRGSTVTAWGSATLLASLVGGAMQGTDIWAAIVGMPDLGVVAAAEHGVDPRRLALVSHPGPDWPRVVAALLDGLALVVVAPPPGGVAGSTVQALVSRARAKRSVLVAYTSTAWAGSERILRVEHRQWDGLGRGRGRLRRGELEVVASGRGAAQRPVRTVIHDVPPPATAHDRDDRGSAPSRTVPLDVAPRMHVVPRAV